MRSNALRATLALLLLAACSYVSQPADPDPGVPPSDPDPSGSIVAVRGVKLVPQSVIAAIGETRQLVLTVAPTNATDKAVTWESTDSSVATVSATGVVTALAPGSGVFITVITHDGHHQASVNVSVVP